MLGPGKPNTLPERRKGAVLSSYVEQASKEITFAKAVVQQHGRVSIPYRDSTPGGVFRLPEILQLRAGRTDHDTLTSKRTHTWAGTNTYAQGSKVLRNNGADSQRSTAARWKVPAVSTVAPSAAEQEASLRYDQQLLSGSYPVYRGPSNQRGSDTIVLDNSLQYRTNVRNTVPEDPNNWSSTARQLPCKVQKRMRTHKRWTSLPTALELEVQDRFKAPSKSATNNTDSQDDPSGVETHLSPKRLHYSLESDKPQRNGMLPIVRQWCRLWNIQLPRTLCAELTVGHVFQQLKSPSQEQQLTAIALCAWPEHIIQPTSRSALRVVDRESIEPSSEEQPWQLSSLVSNLPPAYCQSNLPCALVQVLLEKLRKPDNLTVIRMAIALTFVSLEVPAPECLQVLMEVLDAKNTKDQWIAAQALVIISHSPCHLMPALSLLLKKLLVANNEQREHVKCLLIATSEKTHLVNVLCAEQLNSQSGQERLAACKLLPYLHRHLSRDIANKLIYLLWHDSLADVRHEASIALGSTGHGMLVHDELRSHLLHGNEQEKVDSLKKMGSIGLMTGRLLPVFLECFDNEHMSVRQEAIVTAGLLRLTNEEVLEKLRNLITDSSDEVKRLALEALGLIGIRHQRLLDHLPWAARFERQLEVRAQACQVAPTLCPGHQPMIQVLNDLLVADESDEVRREARDALSRMGIDPEAEWKALELLRAELSQLSTKDKVIREALGSHLHLPMDRKKTRQKLH